jgi:hypothetical protein
MFRHVESDHIIAALLCVALVVGVGFYTLRAPASSDTADEAAPAAQEAALFRSAGTSDLVWIWPRPPAPAPELTQTAAAGGCDEAFRLAGSVDAEGRNQPLGVRMAMAAIIVLEARSREMSICGLTERTNFLSTWRYAQLEPWSWGAQQFKKPSESSTAVARVALTGQFATLRGGAMHFDGAFWQNENWRCRPEMLWRGGTTCFYP